MKRILISLAFLGMLSLAGCQSSEKSGESTDTTLTDDSSIAMGADTSMTDSASGSGKGHDSFPEEDDKIKHVKILYGTDRKEIKITGAYVRYGEAADDIAENYKVGYTIVSVPGDHIPGVVERPSIWKLEFYEDSTKHMINRSIVKLSDKAFDNMLKNVDKGSEAFLFVHGYNNSFKDAALRTCQITEDIGLPIIPIMFSWASNGSTLKYVSDEENVRMAIPAFKDFLKRIAKTGNYKKLHIIAHSMGNRLVAAGLNELKDDPINLKIDQVIMAAPDVYANEFKRDLAGPIIKRAKRVTVYAAKNDWALFSSNRLHTSLRLGQVGRPPFPVKSVDIIDASNVKTDFLGHGTFAQSEAIMTDINKLITSGLAPIQRGIKYQKIGGLDYYYFKKWVAQ